MPFILRGVGLLGIASAGTARDIRGRVWEKLAGEWKPRHLEQICTRQIGLEQLPEVFDSMLAGGSFGRTVVKID
jgi:acrylyl-CoA reductase (NADPH)